MQPKKIIEPAKAFMEVTSTSNIILSTPKTITVGREERNIVKKKWQFSVFLLRRKSNDPRSRFIISSQKKTVIARRVPRFKRIQNSFPWHGIIAK
jgi:hypothetical protein